jgi:hypothetical protein
MALRWDSAVTQRFDWPEYNEGNRHQFKKYHRAGERHSSQGHCQSNGPAISAGLKCQILTTSSMVKLPEGAVEHKMRSYASHPEHSDGRLCEGFRMPALHGHLPSRRDGAGVRKPPGKETASRKGAYPLP